MWMLLQYLKDMWEDCMPWLYAVGLVFIMVCILGLAL